LGQSTGKSVKELRFEATEKAGEVTALYLRPRRARCLLVLAHGAGAGMRHPFMDSISQKLAKHGIATFRFQFPYMERGKKGPDPPRVLTATVRSAVEAADKTARGLPMVAGGKSMGGRMTSLAMSEAALPGIRGVVFFGFPLHQMGKPSSERAAHLADLRVPMLFLQGTRDKLASLDHMKPLCKKLGKRATLHIVDGGDHSFHVPKSRGRSDDEVLNELAEMVSKWLEGVV
jgi:predicted alpha/beta-hydrolase family hydrolase